MVDELDDFLTCRNDDIRKITKIVSQRIREGETNGEGGTEVQP